MVWWIALRLIHCCCHYITLHCIILCPFNNRLIAADRPYWWSYKGNAFASISRPSIEQKSLTCETTPGMPSAEIALLFALLYLNASGQIHRGSNIIPSTSFLRSQVIYGGISFIAFVIVAIAQQYFALHFCHQCYFGIIFGVVIAHLIVRNDLLRLILTSRRRNAFYLFLLVVLISMAFYAATFVIVGDPRWSTHRVSYNVFDF